MPTARHAGRGNNPVPRLEPLDVFARSLHLSGQLGPEDACFPRPSNTKHEFRDREHGLGHEREIADVAVPTRHGGRVYRDQDFVVLGNRLVDLLELEKIGRSVLGVQNRFHMLPLGELSIGILPPRALWGGRLGAFGATTNFRDGH